VLPLVLAAACPSPGPPPVERTGDRVVLTPALPLLAGAASVTITPPGPVRLAGAALGRVSTGVHDDLHARCLVIGNREAVVGLVALDVIGFFYPDVAAVRAEVGADVDLLIVAATHTHSGPDVLGLWGPSFLYLFPYRSGRDERYVAELRHRIAGCVRRARDRLEPVGVSFHRVDVAGFSENVRRPGVKDDELTVMRARALGSGRTVGIVYNFAAHPEIFQHGTAVTADFPAFVNRALAERFGGVPLFVNGAIGALVTVDLRRAPDPEHPTFADAERVTARLRDAVIQAVELARAEVRSAPIAVRTRRLTIPVDNWRFRLARRLGVLGRDGRDGRVETELDTVALGPAQVVTVPGEVSPAIGFAIKRRMPGPFRFLVGLGNDELGYILRPDELRDPLYRYERSLSVGAAAAAIEREVIELLGERAARDPVTARRTPGP